MADDERPLENRLSGALALLFILMAVLVWGVIIKAELS